MVTLPKAIEFRRLAAEKLGYAFEVLDLETGFLYEIRHKDRKKTFASSGSPLNDAVAARLATDKFYTQVALMKAGIRVPKTVRCLRPNAFVLAEFEDHTGLDSGLRFAETHGFPVVIKPNDGTWGLHVRAVNNRDELTQAVQKIWQRFTLALVQEVIPGFDLRLNFLGEALLLGYRRIGAELNLSLRAGGDFEFLSTIDPKWCAFAQRIGQCLGLQHFGIDFKIPHLSAGPEDATVLEVNASPTVAELAERGHFDEALETEMKVLRRWFEEI